MSPIATAEYLGADTWRLLDGGGAGGVLTPPVVTPFVEFDPTAFWNTPAWVLPLGINDVGGPNVGPRPANAGGPALWTAHLGDYTVPGTNHTIPAGTEIFGDLIVPSTYTGCYGEDIIIHGTPRLTSAGYGARGSAFNAYGLHLKWCRIDGALNAPQPWDLATHGTLGAWQNGVGGGNYNLEYCEIRRFVDGAAANNTGDGRLFACRISEGVYRSYYNDAGGGPVPGYTWPSHSDQAVHGDGIQVAGWDGWQFLGLNIGGPRTAATNRGTQLDPRVAADLVKIRAYDSAIDFKNAALMVGSSQPLTNPVGLELSYSRLQGGAGTIQLDSKADGTDLLAGVSIHHVLIGQTDGYHVYKRANCTASISDVVYEPTGAPATVRTY